MNQSKNENETEEKQADTFIVSLTDIDVAPDYSNHIIVPIDELNVMTVQALRYARSITPNVTAFHVEFYLGEADILRQQWKLINTKIPLIIRPSFDREVADLLTEFIDSEETVLKPGDVITVLLPRLVVSSHLQMALHNKSGRYLSHALKRRNINVSTIPFYLDDVRKPAY